MNTLCRCDQVCNDNLFTLERLVLNYLNIVLTTKSPQSRFGSLTRYLLIQYLQYKDGSKCRYCGIKEGATIDHHHALSLGGSHRLDNLVWSCTRCNRSKSELFAIKLPPKPRQKLKISNKYKVKLINDYINKLM